jgi:hypothetical protein
MSSAALSADVDSHHGAWLFHRIRRCERWCSQAPVVKSWEEVRTKPHHTPCRPYRDASHHLPYRVRGVGIPEPGMGHNTSLASPSDLRTFLKGLTHNHGNA